MLWPLINFCFTGIPNPVEDKVGNEKTISSLAAFVHENRCGFGVVFVTHVLCDLAYIGLDILFVYFMDAATNGFMFRWEFLEVFNKDVGDRTDPLTHLFPHIAKCKLTQYSVDGSKSNLYAMCSLVQNVMMERFFIIGWVLFLVFGSMTVLSLAYFLLMSAIPCSRYALIRVTKGELHENLLRKKFSGLGFLQKLGLWYAISVIKSKLDAISYKKFVTKFLEEKTV